MAIKMLVSIVGKSVAVSAGAVTDVFSEAEAERLIAKGLAEAVEPAKPVKRAPARARAKKGGANG